MQSVYSELKKTVSTSPDDVAVEDDFRTLTYAELDVLADTIAARFPVTDPACVGIVMSQRRRRRQEDRALPYRMRPGAEYHEDLLGNVALRTGLV